MAEKRGTSKKTTATKSSSKKGDGTTKSSKTTTTKAKKTESEKSLKKSAVVKESVKKPVAKKESKPKVAKASPKVADELQQERVPRVQVVKKEDVLKRKAEEAAKEMAEKEAAEQALIREQTLKKTKEEEAVKRQAEKEFLAHKDFTPKSTLKEVEPLAKIEPPVKPAASVREETPVEEISSPREVPVKVAVPEPPPVRSTPEPIKVEKLSVSPPPKVAPEKIEVQSVPPPPIEATQPFTKVSVSFPVTLGELAPKLGKTPNELIKVLVQKGMMMTINHRLDEELAKKIASDFGFELDVVDPLELKSLEEEKVEEDVTQLQSRPPVVTVMGHVDHGKTSLLDALRKANVTASEEGGITQRIGAYQVELNNRKITFLDTPGHEAFTSMRARGTKVTDVAVLVVAADDGVMPQTLEALDHAKAANVPIIVAVNKIDKANANVERVKQQLSDHGLIPEEWGGTTVFVPISAKQKTGLEELLEMILLVADLAELKANPSKMARGTIIEGKLDRGKGPVSTVLIQEGTLRVGDAFVAGSTYGKIRAFINDKGERLSEAPPSLPVEIIGLNDVPEAGDIFQVVADDKVARQIAEARVLHTREQTLASLKRVTLDDLYQQIKEGEIKDLNLILKADGQGSVEALKEALERLTTDEIRVRVIHTGVGTITESDVMLAAASNALIIGFNIRPEPHIKNLAEREKVDLRFYRIIYQAIEDITQAMVGMRKPMVRESFIGRAEVLQTFRIGKVGLIAGCRVTDGKIQRDAEVRVLRDGAVVYEGKLASLKRFKDDAREVASGFECGIAVEKFNDIKVGDVIEAFVMEEVRHTTLVGKAGE